VAPLDSGGLRYTRGVRVVIIWVTHSPKVLTLCPQPDLPSSPCLFPLPSRPIGCWTPPFALPTGLSFLSFPLREGNSSWSLDPSLVFFFFFFFPPRRCEEVVLRSLVFPPLPQVSEFVLGLLGLVDGEKGVDEFVQGVGFHFPPKSPLPADFQFSNFFLDFRCVFVLTQALYGIQTLLFDSFSLPSRQRVSRLEAPLSSVLPVFFVYRWSLDEGPRTYWSDSRRLVNLISESAPLTLPLVDLFFLKPAPHVRVNAVGVFPGHSSVFIAQRHKKFSSASFFRIARNPASLSWGHSTQSDSCFSIFWDWVCRLLLCPTLPDPPFVG